MRIVAEHNIGETRAALLEGDRIVELHVERWSERGQRALKGEIYCARISSIDTRLNGAFCDLGRGPKGFLPFGKTGRPAGFHEGAAIGVQVNREAFQAKGPTLIAVDLEEGDAPNIINEAPPLAERLSIRCEAPVRSPEEADIDLNDAFEAALEPVVALSGGGRLIIEPVTAMTVIDVDAGTRYAQSGGAKFALDLNRQAAREAARQIRLRGIGGVVAIDFLPLKKKADQNILAQTLSAAFKNDPAKVDVAPASRFAIIELARQRLGRSLHEIMWQRFQTPSIETEGLRALRQLEREAKAEPSRRLLLKAGLQIYSWLDGDKIGWRQALGSRFGQRFTVEQDDALAKTDFLINRI